MTVTGIAVIRAIAIGEMIGIAMAGEITIATNTIATNNRGEGGWLV